MDWNEYFFRHVFLAASKSKDPSSKIGAALVRNNNCFSIGYNGFPRKVEDTYERLHNREVKYELVVHAETNAIFSAARNGHATLDSILYVCGTPCANCCKSIIQAGISKIVINKKYDELWKANSARPNLPSWDEKSKLTEIMCAEADIPIISWDGDLDIEVLIGGKKYKI